MGYRKQHVWTGAAFLELQLDMHHRDLVSPHANKAAQMDAIYYRMYLAALRGETQPYISFFGMCQYSSLSASRMRTEVVISEVGISAVQLACQGNFPQRAYST